MMNALPAIPDPFLSLARALVLVTIGIIGAQIIAETGLLRRLTPLTYPLCRLSWLSEPAMTAVVSMMFSPTAGKSMLSALYRNRKIPREEIIPALLMGTFPVVLGESLFRIHLPTALILLGPLIGGLHILFSLSAGLLQTIYAIAYTRLRMKSRGGHALHECRIEEHEFIHLNRFTVFTALQRSLPVLGRVLVATGGAFVLFFLLEAAGFIDVLGTLFDPVLQVVGLPGEASAALVAQFLHFSAGYAIVATMFAGGILDLGQALITLLLGSMLIITLIYVKYTGPLYLSLFGRYGITVTLVTYLSSMSAKIIILLLILFLL
jgi:hypothetical protein